MGIYLIHPFVINMLQRNLPAEVWTLSMFPVWFAIVMFTTIGLILMIQKLPLGHIILTVPAVSKNLYAERNRKETLKKRLV